MAANARGEKHGQVQRSQVDCRGVHQAGSGGAKQFLFRRKMMSSVSSAVAARPTVPKNGVLLSYSPPHAVFETDKRQRLVESVGSTSLATYSTHSQERGQLLILLSRPLGLHCNNYSPPRGQLDVLVPVSR